ncbi:hypothetical protein QQS21_003833 [Conoideocrella luteorostrata]|uniref:Xylose isomerase-like TIM barrel domain-containing protein n=1 Tax=Conoideocrella luteorostrata TaxID=1105319 RepID=A0AAJ0CSN6_9HYPO|nr:hypothetical protein QQS21_003833 [Conoideocrella luteorostrata]
MPCQLAITSISLGRSGAGHDFVHKMNVAQQYGYTGIELFHDDLATIAQQLPGGMTSLNELEAAHIIYRICQQRGLSIICLQPFWHYEGLLDRKQHEAHIEKLMCWFQLAAALRTDMIQIPSNFLPSDQLSVDPDIAVADLRKVADLGLAQQPPIRFVYEALAWGTRCDTWEESWRVVQEVDRPNFGLCLDTFNIAARVWADPTSLTGCNPDADRLLDESLQRMVDTIDASKLYCVQVIDAERLTAPLVEGHEFYDAAQPARMSWSRNCRLFYGEKSRGAFLPIDRIAKAIFHNLGYEGWVSMELFNRRMGHTDAGVPRELAARGASSWKRLLWDMDMQTDCQIQNSFVSSVSWISKKPSQLEMPTFEPLII